MTLTMSQASAPVIARVLRNLAANLKKAEENATERKIEPATLLAARLAPDMYPLTRQVQIATDIAKGLGRLAGMDVPSYPDTETTFAELHARIAKTIEFVQSIPHDKLDNTESSTVVLKFPGREMSFVGQEFLLFFSLPNLYFHAGMAYAILRHNGVPLGKMDFLGSP